MQVMYHHSGTIINLNSKLYAGCEPHAQFKQEKLLLSILPYGTKHIPSARKGIKYSLELMLKHSYQEKDNLDIKKQRNEDKPFAPTWLWPPG